MKIYCFLSFVLSVLCQSMFAQVVSDAKYIKVDSIGDRMHRAYSTGWLNLESCATTREYTLVFREKSHNAYFFNFPFGGDTISCRDMSRIKFVNHNRLYHSIKHLINTSTGSVEPLPVKIYIVRPTEKKGRYVKSLITSWRYLDKSLMPNE